MPNQNRRPVGASFDTTPQPVADLGGALRPAVARLLQATGGSSAAAGQMVDAASRMASAQVQAAQAHAALSDQLAQGLSHISARVGQWADEAAAKEGAAAGEVAGLDPEFRAKNDLTIFGEAYDRAGLETYKSQLHTRLEDQVAKAEQAHSEDPGGMSAVMDKIRDETLKGIPPELRIETATLIERRKLAAMRDATRNLVARRDAEQRAALTGEIETRVKSIEQQAYRLGLDPTADKTLAEELAQLKGRLQVNGADGKALFSPESAEKLLRSTGASITEARLKGAFTRLPSTAAREAYVADLQKRYMAGGDALLDSFTPDDFERLAGGMVADIRSEKVASSAATKDLEREVKSVADMAETGYGLSDGDMRVLEAKVRASGDPALAAGYESAKSTLSFVQQARRMPPAELEARVSAARAEMTDGTTPAEVARVKLAEKVLTDVKTEVDRDPLEWASRTGLAQVPALDLSSPQAAAQSLRARASVAETVAGYYGRPVRYFREEEKAALANAARQGGAPLVDMATTIVGALGTDAPKALAEISKDAPEAAVVGGLMTTDGDPMFIKDVANGLQLRATDQAFKPLAPSEAQWRPLVSSAYGNALATSPETQSALVASANAAYEVRARRLGLSEFDATVYGEALQAAAGAVTINGETYGGIAEYNGRQVIVPAEVKQDSFDDLVETIDYPDFPQTHDYPHANGKGVNIATFRRAQLVSIGDGRYWAAMGDPDSADPQYLQDAKGAPYVLDLKKMMPTLRQRRPDYFRGG